MNRRDALGQMAMGAVGAIVAASVPSEGGPLAQSGGAAGKHQAKPLPFDARKLDGLSERMIVSHHDNNYAGAVRNLNKVEEELERVSKETPAFILAGLKEKELTYTNSIILHELYFANLGGGGQTGGRIEKDLGDAFGSLGSWETKFRATGMTLSGGSGWTILDLNLSTGELRTYWSGNHTQALAWGHPLLVMDMYEHAYQIDYGAEAARYIDAFFRNIHWGEVNRRLERGRAAAAALRT